MADLEAVYPTGNRLRYVLGIMGVVLAALAVLTIGGARLGTEFLHGMGVPREGARQIALATMATIPPILLAGVVVLTTTDEKSRLLGLGGIVMALTGIAVGLPFGFPLVGPVVILFYGGGLLLVLAVIGAGLLRDGTDSVDTTETERVGVLDESIGYVDTDSMPADGGADDSELTFLLDEEQ